LALAISISACATVDNPIDSTLLTSLDLDKVNVAFEPSVDIPQKFDESVEKMMTNKANMPAVQRFESYLAQPHISNQKTYLAENYIGFRTQEEINNSIAPTMHGSRDVDLNITIKEAYTPGYTAKVLLGANNGIKYDLDLVDSANNNTIIDFDEPMVIASTRYTPGASRYTYGTSSSAIIGTLISSAISTSLESDLGFLEAMAESVSRHTKDVLTSEKVNREVGERLRENGKKLMQN